MVGAAGRTLTGRGSRTHPNWSGQPNATLTVGAAGRGQEVSSGFALAAHAARSQYIKKMATDRVGGGVGGLTATIATAKIGPGLEFLQKLVPGSNPQKVDTFFFS